MTETEKTNESPKGPSDSKAVLGWNRCDVCGRYISMSDFDSGVAKQTMVTPDSEYSNEDHSTLCKAHIKA